MTTGDREEVTDIGLGGSCEGSEEEKTQNMNLNFQKKKKHVQQTTHIFED